MAAVEGCLGCFLAPTLCMLICVAGIPILVVEVLMGCRGLSLSVDVVALHACFSGVVVLASFLCLGLLPQLRGLYVFDAASHAARLMSHSESSIVAVYLSAVCCGSVAVSVLARMPYRIGPVAQPRVLSMLYIAKTVPRCIGGVESLMTVLRFG